MCMFLALTLSQVKLQKRVVCYIETEHNIICIYHPIAWVRVRYPEISCRSREGYSGQTCCNKRKKSKF